MRKINKRRTAFKIGRLFRCVPNYLQH